MSATRDGAGRRRPGLVWAVLAAAILAAAVLIGGPPADGEPLDPRGTGPLGALGLVRTLEALGSTVTTTDGPPGEDVDVALVLADRLGTARRREVTQWVRDGGTLVVADPASELVPVPRAGELSDPRADAAGCGIDALADVEQLAVDGVGFAPGVGDRGCLSDGESFFVTATPAGAGTVVAVGGAGVWVNERLADADNAVLAAALLAPVAGTEVAVLLEPPVGDGTATLPELVDDGVLQAVAQLGVAFLLYALWRGRRLGPPVEEPQPVELAASELVVARGHLLEQGRHAGAAAAVLRDDLRRRLCDRLGLPPTATPAEVADAAAARTTLERTRVLALLEPAPVEDPAALAELAAGTSDAARELARDR